MCLVVINTILSYIAIFYKYYFEFDNRISAVSKIVSKLREMGDRLVATNEDIQRSLTQSNTMTERAYNDISRSYETLRTEVIHL